MLLKAVVLALTVVHLRAEEAATDADFDRLFKDLFTNYNTEFPPAAGNVTVQYGINAICLELDSRAVLKGRIWERMKWNDPRLAYDPANYGGIKVIRVDPTNVFVPDIVQYNRFWSEENRLMLPHRVKGVRSNILVYPTGDVLFVPDSRTETFCSEADLTDVWADQKCKLKIGSWTFHSGILNLAWYDDKVGMDMEDYDENCQVEIVESHGAYINKSYQCCPDETYPSLDFYLTVRRRYIETDKGIMFNPRIGGK